LQVGRAVICKPRKGRNKPGRRRVFAAARIFRRLAVFFSLDEADFALWPVKPSCHPTSTLPPDVTAVAVVGDGQVYARLGSGGSGPVPKQKNPTASNSDAPIERRGQPRGDGGATDWETIVLKRVERHVESLSGDANSCVDAPNQSGWEEAALLALRRRIRDLKAE